MTNSRESVPNGMPLDAPATSEKRSEASLHTYDEVHAILDELGLVTDLVSTTLDLNRAKREQLHIFYRQRVDRLRALLEMSGLASLVLKGWGLTLSVLEGGGL